MQISWRTVSCVLLRRCCCGCWCLRSTGLAVQAEPACWWDMRHIFYICLSRQAFFCVGGRRSDHGQIWFGSGCPEMPENLENQAKNVLTHAEAYNIIGECESVWKCWAKAPARHFEDKKQDTPCCFEGSWVWPDICTKNRNDNITLWKDSFS